MKSTKLKQYFSSFKVNQTRFSREVGLHPNHFSRIINGKKATSTGSIKLMRLTLQNLLDKKFQEHEKRGMELQEQQRLLNEALEELCQIAQTSKPLDSLSHSQPSQQDLLSCGTESEH